MLEEQVIVELAAFMAGLSRWDDEKEFNLALRDTLITSQAAAVQQADKIVHEDGHKCWTLVCQFNALQEQAATINFGYFPQQ